MRWELTSDQQFFRETTARFLEDQVPVATLRALRDDPLGAPPDYWRRGAELGWTSLLVGERLGGGSISDAGLVDLTLVAHEFGRHAAPGPLTTANVAVAALAAAGDAHAAAVAAVVAGESVVSWAYGEPIPHDGFGTVTLEVRDDGDSVVVAGVKRPVEAATQADAFLVTGRSGDGLTQVLVPADAVGVAITPLTTVDLTRRCGTVSFADVRLPASAVVGEMGGAAEQVEHQVRLASVLCAAETTGAMQRAFEMTVEWAFERYSFGRPLASYQALKHRFADMKMWLEASHAASDAAADAVAEGAVDAAARASAAKAYTGDQGSELAHECVQLHGGIGVTFEHDLHLFLRRITLNRSLYGTPADHRQRLAALLIAREEAA
ncbi:MAG: acyl-CoA dehydrogenase [Actinobacteria bacterium]|nr:acyl-CoA dehydrogenase [Actinomycetota bacterium]